VLAQVSNGGFTGTFNVDGKLYVVPSTGALQTAYASLQINQPVTNAKDTTWISLNGVNVDALISASGVAYSGDLPLEGGAGARFVFLNTGTIGTNSVGVVF